MILKRTSGLILPKTHPKFEQIERDLNRIVYGFNGDVTRMIFYENVGDSIMIPRYYPLDDEIEDLAEDGEDIDINSKIVPRNTRQEKAITFLTNNNNGILKIEPGSGKSVISIAVISKVKKRAIIFSHKTKLLDQWKEMFLRFTDIKEDDIGKLSTANYKKIFDKKIILCTPHIIAIAVTKNKTNFLKALECSRIGVAVFDEVHTTIGPMEFSKASLHLNCKRIYGLSATPTRNDGNDDIIKYHVGEITYFEPTEFEIVKPKIYMIYFDFGVYKKYRRYISWGGKFSLTRYFQQMYKIDKYLDTVVVLINKCFDEGRVTLVLGMRINTLLELAKRCKAAKKDVGFFVPTSTSEEKLSISDTDDLDIAFKTKKLVFSTYNAARDGSNREDLDCIVHSTPSSNVEQSVGRAQRSMKGKKQPVVFDLVDTDGPKINSYNDKTTKVKWFIRSAEKRKEVFVKKGWMIEEIRLK